MRRFSPLWSESGLTPECFRFAHACAMERIRAELAQQPDRRPALERERTSVARKIERMIAAIGEGRGPAALVSEIAKAEARLQEIDAALARLIALPALDTVDLRAFEEAAAKQLARFAELMRGNVPLARQALKKLLVDHVGLSPTETPGGGQTYAFKADLTYGAVIQEVIYLRGVPRGI